MKNVIDNNTDSIKKFLNNHKIEDIILVKHIGNFIFEAITPSGFIKIFTEPFDDEQNYIKVLSFNIVLEKSPLTVEEQELLVYLAKYKPEKMYNFFNTKLCKKQYCSKDIADFRSIVDSNNSINSSIQMYWNLDTAARDYFIEIIHKVFCTTLLK